MKTPEERGAIGAWAYTARDDAGLSVEEVADRLRERGHAINPATLRGIESGNKKPGRALLTALSELYGLHPPNDVGGPLEGDLAPLVEATTRQAEASERLGDLLEGILGALTSMGPPLASQAVQQEWQNAEEALAEQSSGQDATRPRSPSPGRSADLS